MKSLAAIVLLAHATLAACSSGSGSSSTGSAQAGPGGQAASSTMSTGGAAGSGGTAGVGGAGGMGGGCQDTLAPMKTLPDKLSATGLYSDIAKKTIASGLLEFAPKHLLWSDGADKRRWVYLPECASIDTSNMDDWQLPIGTRMFKEFSYKGKLLETRIIHRNGPEEKDYLYVAYQWNEAQTEAVAAPEGASDVGGTKHNIPDVDACKRCHGPAPQKGGLPSRYLGFSAIQLSHKGPGVTLASLTAAGKLSAAPKGDFAIPGNAIEQAALGYLHANCASCHNDTSDGLLYPALNARIKTGDSAVALTGAYTTMVNQKTTLFVGLGCEFRIAGGSIANSCARVRMNDRSDPLNKNTKQMPPLASEFVDQDGLAALDAWITILPAPQ